MVGRMWIGVAALCCGALMMACSPTGSRRSASAFCDTPGESGTCGCAGGVQGTRTCGDDKKWSTCDCPATATGGETTGGATGGATGGETTGGETTGGATGGATGGETTGGETTGGETTGGATTGGETTGGETTGGETTGGETTGGETTGGTTGGGGQCASTGDKATLAQPGIGDLLYECMGAGGGVASCLTNASAMSLGCAGCLEAAGNCIVPLCTDCMQGFTAQCVSCAAGTSCVADFEACAGVALPLEAPACVPQCGGKECGPDGCGDFCGECAAGTCSNGQCETTCTPDCGGKACGSDGCGGVCGSCGAGTVCEGSSCVPDGTCEPTCDGINCGGPDQCGGTCGCSIAGQVCQGGICEGVSNCDLVSYEGCCDGDIIKYCDGSTVQEIECNPGECGWKLDTNIYDCGGDGSADPSGQNPIACPPGA